MPWCPLFTTDGLPPAADRAIRQLNARVQGALSAVQHDGGFVFGKLPGTTNEMFFSALNVELSFSDAFLTGRPRLERLGFDRFRYNAPPNRREGCAHRDFGLNSDVLRALFRSELRNDIQDEELLNAAGRDFADGWLFGHPVHFVNKLEQCDGLLNIHEKWELPLSALGGYCAKLNLGASLDTIFLVREPYGGIHPKHFHRFGKNQDPAALLAQVKLWLPRGGDEVALGAKSQHFKRTASDGSLQLANVSARMMCSKREDESPFDDLKVVRVIITSLPREPVSARGPLH